MGGPPHLPAVTLAALYGAGVAETAERRASAAIARTSTSTPVPGRTLIEGDTHA